MNRPLVSLAAGMLSLAVVTGCGTDEEPSADGGASSSSPAPSPEEDQAPEESAPEQPGAADAPGAGTKYCDLLGSDLASVFAGAQTPEGVDKVVTLVGDVADAAPEEVGNDWRTMEGALADSKPQLVAGAKLQEQVQSGEITQKEAMKEAQKIQKSMEDLNAPKFQQAGASVAQHAAQHCGVSAGQQ